MVILSVTRDQAENLFRDGAKSVTYYHTGYGKRLPVQFAAEFDFEDYVDFEVEVR